MNKGQQDRKEAVPFYFSVEGDCEKIYLEFLQQLINDSDLTYKVSFDIKVNINPESAIKKFSNLKNLTIYHLFDYEEATEENDKKFKCTLERMKNASKLKGKNKYLLAYSNISFDLWIILHKISCHGSYKTVQQYLPIINNTYGKNFKTLTKYKKEDNFKKLLSTITLDDVRHAIEQNKKIMKACEKNYQIQEYCGYKYYKENPSLNVGECIEKILLACK